MARRASTALQAARSASETPRPCEATASNSGHPCGFSAARSRSIGSAAARSRLFHWNTRGSRAS